MEQITEQRKTQNTRSTQLLASSSLQLNTITKTTFHPHLRVPLPLRATYTLNNAPDPLITFFAQFYINSTSVFFQILDVFCSWDRDEICLLSLLACDISFRKASLDTRRKGRGKEKENEKHTFSLRQNPSQNQLSSCTRLLPCHPLQPLQPLYKPPISLKILLRETRKHPPRIALRKILSPLDTPRQEPLAQRRVRIDHDAQLPRRRQELRLRIFNLQRKGRELYLRRRNGVDLACSLQRPRRTLAQAQIANLAFRFQLSHRSDRLLDRRVGVDAVLRVQIDSIRAETFERLGTCGFDIFLAPIDFHHRLPVHHLHWPAPEIS